MTVGVAPKTLKAGWMILGTTPSRVTCSETVVAVILMSLAFAIGVARIAGAQGAAFSTAPGGVRANAGNTVAPHRAPLGPRLTEALLARDPAEAISIRVTLRFRDLPSPGPARRRLISARQDRVLATPGVSGVVLRRRYKEVAGFAIALPAAAIEALVRHPEVVAIHLDGEVHMVLGQGRALIGSDTLTNLGVRGAGINVAVLDTGIDTDHTDLLSSLVAEQCFCDTHPSPQFGGCCPGNAATASGPGAAEDDEGHGTSVSGIITSDGVVGPLGVAPDAGIVAVKVLSSSGVGANSDIDAALDWVLQNHAELSIRVVNMSLSDGGQYDSTGLSICSTTPSAVAIADLAAAGVAVFAASGNDGHDAGISAPACIAEAISVGGVYDAAVGTVSWCGNANCSTILCTDVSAADVFVCHTNSGSLLDVLAPDWRTLTDARGGGTRNFGGTSAASPYAAAVAAILFELVPSLTPSELRIHLTGTGVSVTNSDNGLSFPRINVVGSVSAALANCGDAVLDPGESCDDGNTIGGDCCSSICTFEAAGSSCSDGTVCTTGDLCDGAGVCAGTAIVCDDANGCTDDACDPIGGCGFTPNSAACDDGNACTTGDVCSTGSCSPGSPLVCDDANGCTDDACDPLGGCGFTPNSAACDDGDACTTGDVCSAGSCSSGSPLVCDDANGCTDDACNPTSGCVFVANSVSCEDGSVCTTGDVCSAGSCVSGSVLDCDDFDVCTADACDEIDGCTHTAIPGCGVPLVPSLGPKGRIGLVLFLGSVGGLMALLLDRRRGVTEGAEEIPNRDRLC